ncbi:hypothetical protein RJT34_05977 [Clitoria ternatea]|uniref:Uncharacterized protein n=1 Tax=Clitoria ternatea TaxID=43366 RepID=A0AAN9K2W8_CLITE
MRTRGRGTRAAFPAKTQRHSHRIGTVPVCGTELVFLTSSCGLAQVPATEMDDVAVNDVRILLNVIENGPKILHKWDWHVKET